ncbi:co-chaperone GroES [Candidatus Berkelbacteria bacterium]|nr:co-chaperone GroES [Candidatus Berkelbacteria bacterium]
MTTLRPLGSKVVVEPLAKDEMTKSGIYIPETVKEKPQEGKVLAIGAGKYIDGKLVALDVKVGDKVLFSKYGGDEIKIDDKELKVIDESDILAIIE